MRSALPSGLTMYGLVLPLQKTLHFFQSNSREKEPQGENRTGRKTIVSPPCTSAMLWLDCWSLKLFTAVAVVLYGLVTMACVNWKVCDSFSVFSEGRNFSWQRKVLLGLKCYHFGFTTCLSIISVKAGVVCIVTRNQYFMSVIHLGIFPYSYDDFI